MLKISIKEKLFKLKQWNLDNIKLSYKKNNLKFWQRPKDFIKKALGNLKPFLNLSILKNPNGILTDDLDSIKTIVTNYFKKILEVRQFTITSDWQETYEP